MEQEEEKKMQDGDVLSRLFGEDKTWALPGILLVFVSIMVMFRLASAQQTKEGIAPTVFPIAQESARAGKRFVAGEILIRVRPGADRDIKRRAPAKFGFPVREELKRSRLLKLSVEEGVELETAEFLSKHPEIEYAEVNTLLYPDIVPNDVNYSKQWHLPKIGMPAAWDVTRGSNMQVIAILDSGIDTGHPDLSSKILPGYDFYYGDFNPSDVYGHGTAVAGVAAAVTNNAVGVASPGWETKILPVKVASDANGSASVSTIVTALVWAADQGARVVNLSFGGVAGSASIRDAANYLRSKGGVVVASAGNCSCLDGTVENTSIISVSATDQNDNLAIFSTRGSFVDLSAPGVSLPSTLKGGGYGNVSGTSFSSPVTAAVISLLFAVRPDLTPNQVENILEITADDKGLPGYDTSFGWGRINAEQALKKAISYGVSPDMESPTSSITSPLQGATLSGIVSVAVNAADNKGVVLVELWKDGVLFGSDATSPYVFSWNTTEGSNGTHTIFAKAYDAAGNVGNSAQRSVMVNNTGDTVSPTITKLSPSAGTVVTSDKITVSGSATDNIEVTEINLYFDSKLIKSCYNTKSCSVTYTVSKVSSGAHSVSIRARDAKNNIAEKKNAITKK